MADYILSDLPKSCAEAAAIGSPWYFTGKSCKRGHLDARFTSTRACVSCHRLALRQQRADHLEVFRERDRKHKARQYAEDPEPFKKRALADYEKNKEKRKSGFKQYRLNNLERERQKDRDARNANLELFRARAKISRQNNRERVRTANRNRKAALRNAEGKHTAKDVRRIRAEQNDKCAECGDNLNGKGHVDHKIPIARGGTNWPENLQLLCEFCNCSKWAHLPEEFGVIKRPATRLGAKAKTLDTEQDTTT